MSEPQRGTERHKVFRVEAPPQNLIAIHSPVRMNLWYHTDMQGQRDRFSGMSDEQIAAALAQKRRAATDKMSIEELVTTVRQTAASSSS